MSHGVTWRVIKGVERGEGESQINCILGSCHIHYYEACYGTTHMLYCTNLSCFVNGGYPVQDGDSAGQEQVRIHDRISQVHWAGVLMEVRSLFCLNSVVKKT